MTPRTWRDYLALILWGAAGVGLAHTGAATFRGDINDARISLIVTLFFAALGALAFWKLVR